MTTKTVSPPHRDRSAILVCLFLALLTLAVFGRVHDHPFVAYDDDLYVYLNPNVRTGLTLENLEWAWTTRLSHHWHPLTWMSHMLDCELFGLNAGGHHLSSLLLHAINVLLLFGLLRRTTGAPWRSAFAAALFAVHPLIVEPVAWVASRKDLLSTLFLLLTLWAYTTYAKQGRTGWYLAALACFVLGLLSKSMIVTLPFLLVLIDVWPLRRLPWGHGAGGRSPATPRRWVLEKVPFLGLAVVFGLVAFFAMKSGSPTAAQAPVSELLLRAGRLYGGLNMLAAYLERVVWPHDLAVTYPWQAPVPAWKPVAGLLLAVGLSGVLLFLRNRRRAWAVGWFWFLVTLFPLLGIVGVGPVIPADRYMYVPLMGLAILAAWAGGDLLWGRFGRPVLAGTLAGLLLLGFSTVSWFQVETWSSSEGLFRHAIDRHPGNAKALNNLGNLLATQGRLEEAAHRFRAALQARPDFAEAHSNLGLALLTLGGVEEALFHLRRALEIDPAYAEARNNLGIAMSRLGRYEEAAQHHLAALKDRPRYPEALNNLGNALAVLNEPGRAESAYRKALTLRPDYFEAHKNLGRLLLSRGKGLPAIRHLKRALDLYPGSADTRFLLASAYVQTGENAKAAVQFRETLRLQPDHVEALFKLGNLLALEGRMVEASDLLRRAVERAPRHAPARLALGLALLARGRVQDARSQAQALDRLRPGLAEILRREIAQKKVPSP